MKRVFKKKRKEGFYKHPNRVLEKNREGLFYKEGFSETLFSLGKYPP